MTDKQRQNLLSFLGHDPGTPDNIWGARSRQAMENFQRKYNLTVTGTGNEETDAVLQTAVANWKPPVTDTNVDSNGFWDEIEFFDREEFRCQCGKYCNGFPVEPEEKMVRTVDEIRRRLGVPISIVDAGGSGVRCETHNAAVGGVYNSEHLYGRAADLHSSASPARMKAVAEEVMGTTGGLGLYGWGIHVDTGKYSRWNG